MTFPAARLVQVGWRPTNCFGFVLLGTLLLACGDPGQPVAPPFSGVVSGSVAADSTGLSGVTVTLSSGAAVVASVATGVDGRYTFRDVLAGQYEVGIRGFADGIFFLRETQWVTVSESTPRVSAHFSGSWLRTSSVHGAVTGGGRPLAGVEVAVARASARMSARTDENGRYSFGDLRSGTYVVAISGYDTDAYRFLADYRTVQVGPGERREADFVGNRLLDGRTVLTELYRATGGEGWNDNVGWLDDDQPLEEWYGVTTNPDGEVSSLHLADNALAGRIPPELGSLSALESLDLGGNALSGPAPAELGTLTRLRTLDIADNQLTGSLPETYGVLDSLQSFRAGGSNRLCVPSRLSRWHAAVGETDALLACAEGDRAILETFFEATGGRGWKVTRNWNRRDRPLSEWLGVEVDDEGRVTGLSLADNGLAGTVPPELGAMSALRDLDLSRNDLTGPVPPELGALVDLRTLELGGNSLQGAIPHQLGALRSLEQLALGGNDLTGPIPPELGALSSLERLGLSSNALTGSIPPELGALTRLTQLDLAYNELTGTIPRDLATLTHLGTLSLEENALSGAIPPELGSLTRLAVLSLRGNALSGAIPPDLGSLEHIIDLDLADNRLTGSIPPELTTRLSTRERPLHIDLSGNRLTGEIPPELGSVAELRSLHLQNNRLEGRVPSTFVDLGEIRSFYAAGTNDVCLPSGLTAWHAAIPRRDTLSVCEN